MKKKVLLFFLITVALFGAVLGIVFKYVLPDSYMVFVEAFEHGVITVDGGTAKGTDEKYRVECDIGEEITVNINPERNDDAYYNLDRLYVNGINVTKQVSMLQYKTQVDGKLNIIAFFKKGKRPASEESKNNVAKTDEPKIDKYAADSYLGSLASYDISDPSVIYDSDSGYYYCFGSDNVVIRSKNLVDWTSRTTYFNSPEEAKSNSVMTFSTFPEVQKWAKAHGYSNDETFSDSTEDRTPSSPEIVKIDGTYYLYFSLTKAADTNESAIFCVKTDNLWKAITEKSWEEVGLVISTCGEDDGKRDSANAVHPSVIETNKGVFMVYGGYYGKENIGGEIYLVALGSDGLLKKGGRINGEGEKVSTLHGKKTFNTGILLAKPGKLPSESKSSGSLISAADIMYNKKTGYFYLLMTYGKENTNSEVRVARSKSIEGPFVDYNGKEMSDYGSSSRNNQYTKGTQLLSGYGFASSSKGSVSYSNVGKAALASPDVIYTDDGTWLVAVQSQAYFDIDGTVTTGYKRAIEKSLDIEAYPALDMRQMLFTSDGWPMALCEMYSGEEANRSFKGGNLYGDWDVIVFDDYSDSKDSFAVTRSTSSTLSILHQGTVSANDIKKGNSLKADTAIKRTGNHYTLIIDSVEYAIYPAIVWDWELQEGSITFTGIGADGSTIWGKKNTSGALGLYTDTLYYLLDKCDETLRAKYENKIKKFSKNPTQSAIDSLVTEIAKKLA